MTTSIEKIELSAFAFLGAISIVSILAAFYSETYYLSFIPLGLLIAYLAVINFKILYFFLLATIPFSIEFSFSGSLGTDLPDEPLMIGLMLVSWLFILTSYKSVPTGFFSNLLVATLLLHLFWIFIASLNSANPIVSFKIFAAKVWYISTFCFLTAIVLKTKEDLRKAFWYIYIPLTLLIVQVIFRHGMQGFSFDDINKPMYPFFRNHVNYAAILSVFFPLIIWARRQYPSGSFKRKLLTCSLFLYAIAIYLSYTRTCYIALLILLPVYLVIHFRLMKMILITVTVSIMVLLTYLFTENHYLKFAPNFEETIIHDEFGQHLSSTFEGKDVSSMERVYRWVAATRMFQDKPWMGFGPGNFNPYYKSYTVTSFETYVSDNPEGSTTHNYPLMLLTEQGIIGLVIFAFLTILIFVYGETLYHRVRNANDKQMALFVLLMLAMVYVNLLLSDMLESDKVGPFFFIGIALLAAIDIRNRLPKAQA